MRVKWFIIALILVVLPAAILSTLAARAIRHYELIMQAELEQDASRVLSAVDSAVRDKTLHALEMVRISLASTLTPDAGPEKLTPISRRIVRENEIISDVFAFMNPWGFLATSITDPQDPDTSIRLDFLVNELRVRLPAEARRAKGGPPLSGISFLQNARAYYFAPMPGTASVWAGYAADRMALDTLLTQCIEEHTAGGMVLSYVTDSLRSPNEDVADVVVSDSLSPESLAEARARERGTPDLPILASTFLAPPLDSIEILAQAAPGIEIRQIAAARTRLYAWGLAIVVTWVLIGIGIVLRQTVVEIHQARQRGEFLLGVSHDLRTPLASMRMLAESMAQGNVRKQEQPRFMNTIVSECDRLARLIERVLYLVRYGQGALVYHRRDVDMGTVLQKAVADMKAHAHSLQLKIEPELPHIQGDRSALAQVVLNLLDNAIKYGRRIEGEGNVTTESTESTEKEERSPDSRDISFPLRASVPSVVNPSSTDDKSSPPTRVELTIDTVSRRRYLWSPARRWVRLTVRDFGMGIARHEQRRIFQRFYRSSRAHDRNVSGVGLGLALCRHVIRSHGGWIEVESEVGEGTTFRVYLKCGEGRETGED